MMSQDNDAFPLPDWLLLGEPGPALTARWELVARCDFDSVRLHDTQPSEQGERWRGLSMGKVPQQNLLTRGAEEHDNTSKIKGIFQNSPRDTVVFVSLL